MSHLLTYAVPGLPYGCVYALVAVGLVLTFKTSGVFNLAFGAQAYVSAAVFTASARSPELGFVGDVEAVNPDILRRLLSEELIPVVATIGSDAQGQAYNINADTAAGAIASALEAEKLVYLTDIEGLRRDEHDPATLISAVSAGELEAMVDAGELRGGMLPKVASCVQAVRRGVGRAHILDGRLPHALLLEVFTNEGIGTMVMP